MFLGLAIAVKLTPAVLLIFLWHARDRRAVLVTAISASVLTAVGFLLAPRDSISYWSSLDSLGDRVHVFAASNVSVWGLGGRLPVPRADLVIGAVLTVLAVVLTWRGMGAAFVRGRRDLAFGLAAVLVPLLSPVSWEHHWVWMLPLVISMSVAAWRGDLLLGATVAATLLLFRETGVSGQVPLSWTLYPLWGMGALVLVLHSQTGATRAVPGLEPGRDPLVRGSTTPRRHSADPGRGR